MKQVQLSIMPKPNNSAFAGGLSVSVTVGDPPPDETVQAAQQPDGTWLATLNVNLDTATTFTLIPANGVESTPYDELVATRTYAVTASTTTLYAAEGIYGLCERGPAHFGEPPSRSALMEAAFGSPVMNTGIFQAREMPHGPTLLGDQVYFVVHAPHAVCATLILAIANGAGGLTRKEVPMSLTEDDFYWWCAVPAAQASPDTKYRLLLNDTTEVIDPAARAVFDGGSLVTAAAEDPNDANTSWSMVMDIAGVYNAAHLQQWQTLGWDNFLIYEIHARRFTNIQVGTPLPTPFDLLVDELSAMSRLGRTGYLRALPVTVFELLPVTEFSHAAGRGVMLDMVYNHSLTSSLVVIAPEYSNGQYDGDKMNCGNPMMIEYFRQATIFLFRTYSLDGFRLDDTQTVVASGGWGFLGTIRDSLRKAASAEGRNWPYIVAENSATQPWDISNPTSGVTDGQWGIDESYRIEDACYDLYHPGSDESQNLMSEMNNPAYSGRPYFQAVRFGESHDMVSAQNASNQRIAARPPFGFGYQMAKAMGTLTLLSSGTPMLFMGQEIGETDAFSFPDNEEFINPQNCELPPGGPTDQTRIMAWFRQLMGLRNDPSQGLRGEANYQVVATGTLTVAYTCGTGQQLFAVVTFGTPDQQQDSSWLGLPSGSAYKEIFNSSWPAFQVEFEPEHTNGGYDAEIYSGQILNLPYVGAVVLQRR
jgi:1,4-alpha-glucan branching enzyme